MPQDSPEPANKLPNDPALQQSATHSSTASDNEGGEKPVREKLRKTTINPGAAGSKSQASATDPTASASDADDEASGDRMDGRTRVRLARKRSLEDMDHSSDIDNDRRDSPTFNRHIRKRSRDTDSDGVERASPHGKPGSDSSDSVDPRPSTPDERMDTNAIEQHLTSPKGKRNREQFLKDNEESEIHTLDMVATKPADVQELAAVGAKLRDNNEERDAKRQRDGASAGLKSSSGLPKESTTTLPASSGFANASSASPFASLQGIKPAGGPETSKAAFEASSFSKLAQSSTSPFGALGTSLGGSSSFGGLANKKSDAQESPEKPKVLGSAFGSAAKSPFASVSTGGGFGSAPSAFAKFGAGTTPSLFGSAIAGPGPSGGSKPTIVGLNSKPSRPFGAPDTDDEGNGPDSSGDEDDEGEDDDPQAKLAAALQDELKRDRRFHEHYVETGEEHEETVFTARAKLFSYENKEWHERGHGNIKLNVTRDDDFDDEDEDDDDEPEDIDNSHSSADGSTKEAAAAKPSDGENGDEEEEEESDLAAKGPPARAPAAPRPIKARFILRADGSHRLVLNSPLTKQTSFGGDRGARPTGMGLFFHGHLEGGGSAPALLRLHMKAQLAKEMWDIVEDTKKRL